MTDQEIRDVVASILTSIAPDAGFQGADVAFETDWDGEAVISVRARFERWPADPDPLMDAAHTIRTALIAKGEVRFVFLTFDIETERLLEPEDVD